MLPEINVPVKSRPKLSQKDEQELAVRIQDGDEKAVDIFVESNIGLVITIAHEMSRNNRDMLNVFVAAGIRGVDRAARRFQPDKGAKFSTYASWWIKLAINTEIRNQATSMKIPQRAYECFLKVRRFVRNFRTEHGNEPTLEQIAKELPQFPQSLINSVRFLGDSVSLDGFMPDSDKPMHELVPSKSRMPFDDIVKTDDVEMLKEALKKLDDRQRYVIKHRFGIGCEKETLEIISEEIGLTRERVRQIEVQSLDVLKKIMKELD